MAELQGNEPNWERMPPEIEDFPYDVQKAMSCYGKLQDRVESDVGFLGKDFTLFPILVKTEHIEDESLFLEALLQIDSFFIDKSRKDMEEARKRAERGKKRSSI